jgi:hypothetical protein
MSLTKTKKSTGMAPAGFQKPCPIQPPARLVSDNNSAGEFS